MWIIRLLARIALFIPGVVNGFLMEYRRLEGDTEGSERLKSNWVARTSKEMEK